MVLAIGLVVDDAIVVVEAVEYELKYNGLSPKEAAIKAMENVQGPVIGIAFVLVAVFVPGCLHGWYDRYSLQTVCINNRCICCYFCDYRPCITPALCATMLKPHTPKNAKTGYIVS